MYSRSYNTSASVPPNYNGTSIQIEKPIEEESDVKPSTPEEVNEELLESKPYARVPLMEKPVYSSRKPMKDPVFTESFTEIDEEVMVKSNKGEKSEKPWRVEPEKPGKDIIAPIKKISADDILLIGLLIILLGCENVDIKLIIAIGVLLFVGL